MYSLPKIFVSLILCASFAASPTVAFAETLPIEGENSLVTAVNGEVKDDEPSETEEPLESQAKDTQSDTEFLPPIDPVAGIKSSLLPTKDNEEKAVSRYTIDKNDKLVAENSGLALYLNEKDFVLKLENKATGYIFSSSVRKDSMQGMSTEWQRVSQSMLVMDFIAANGTEKRSALKHASAKKPVITKKDSGFSALVSFHEAKTTLEMEVTLTEKGIKVNINDDSIQSKDGIKVGRIYIMPFFGNSYADTVPGYMFVPDGSGALIEYSKPRSYNQAYRKRIYGNDISVQRLSSDTGALGNIPRVEENSITMPVFGAVHGVRQNGFVGLINSGDEYCEINASPAGVVVDYSWIAPSFIYNELYWQPSGKGQGFNTVQTNQNIVNPEVEYILLNGDDATYAGMAKEYRSRLNLEKKVDVTKGDIPIKLDALMAEPTKSLFGTSTQLMTKVSDVDRWIDILSSNGITHAKLNLMGFESGGLSGHKIGEIGLEKKVGSVGELRKTAEKLSAAGGTIALQSDMTKGYTDQVKKSSVRYGIDRAAASIVKKAYLFDETLFLNDTATASCIDNLLSSEFLPSLPSLGNQLYSDFNRKGVLDRTASLNNRLNLLEKLADQKPEVSLENPNAYALKYASSVYGIETKHSQLMYFSQAVPFKQMVMSGNMDCFSEYLNYGTNTIDDILKLIDFNTYPSYILTGEYPNKLSKTNMNNVYSSRFDDLSPYIVENYQYLNNILKNVRGSSITDRHCIRDGVSVTNYDNGKTVIVNYTEEPVDYKTSTLEPKSAIVIEGV